jgi:SAM-dependent methyltransferase
MHWPRRRASNPLSPARPIIEGMAGIEGKDRAPLEVSTVRAADDPMYQYAPELYLEAGESAIRWIDIALDASDAGTPWRSMKGPPRRILDYACAYGRVLRWLRAAYPDAELVAADIFEEPPAFCRHELGADAAVRVPEDPSSLDLGGYDLIWCGSLLSHTDESLWEKLLALFRRSTQRDGLTVFTTNGETLVRFGLRTGDNPGRFTPYQLEIVLRDYDATGFGYWPTLNPTHGDCVASPAWIAQKVFDAGLQIVLYAEAAWLQQDLIAVTPR